MRLPSRRLLLIASAMAFSLLGDQVLYSVLPVFYEELALAPFQVGILLSANRWVRLVTNHLAHWVSERFPVRWLLPAAFFLGALTTAAYAVHHAFAWLLGARIVWGLAWSFIRHLGVLTLVAETPSGRSGETMGFLNGISRLGSVSGLFVGALLVERLGFQTALFMLFALSLISVPLGAAGASGASAIGARAGPGSAGGGWQILWLGFTLGVVGPGIVMSTLGHLLDVRLDARLLGLGAASLTGALLAVRFLLDGFAAPLLGILSDRLGALRTAAACFLCGGGALALAAASVGAWALTFWMLVFFVSATTLNAAVAGLAAARGSATYARYVTAADVGSAAGPTLGWAILAYSGDGPSGFVLASALYVVAGFAAMVGRQEAG